MKGTSTPIVAAALAVALLSTAGAATAAPGSSQHSWTVTAGEPDTLATGLVGPLRVAVGRGNTAYVSQNFGGMLTSVARTGKAPTLVTEPTIEIGGVSTRHGEVYFTRSAGGDPGNPGPLVATVNVIKKGKVRMLADLAALETANNYDAGTMYGFKDLPASCAADLPPEIPPAPYPGDINSHPYATAVSNSGRYVYVADAGANAVLTIDTRSNTVSAAVLEPVPTLITAELVASLSVGLEKPLPDCLVGETFIAEPVPTDIEIGPDGMLYVTSLPGGPEDPTLGSVRRINPATGTQEVVASGLTTPTGLALDRRGNIFIAELFAGRISVIAAGTNQAVPLLEAVLPADVEIDGKYLYATTNALPSDPEEPSDPEAPSVPEEPNGTLVRAHLDYSRQ
ncbi:ScyD/ScyE family protein [Arthrobacter burdickii]|uniref:ScyD/ScyE family protein n=1 Tax=Arthrobacter burdickii TaxID=3035920 RepID=A0ABT8K4I7_9MICC|nr:ScyD/ScyE family protein [Arthrobacter burdickii]MDN4612371.1 ScyD/ScyE family protein [Arthrobacter burdickii]